MYTLENLKRCRTSNVRTYCSNRRISYTIGRNMSIQHKHSNQLMWETLKKEHIHNAGIFSLERVHRRSADGRTAPFYRIDTTDWVTVVAVLDSAKTPRNTPENHEPTFLLVRQYRHGSASLSLEFPAGNVNRGENPAHAAERELQEETGYKAQKVMSIGAVSQNPALLTNTTHTFLAVGLQSTGRQNLDENELLNVETMGFSKLKKHIGQQPMDSAISVQAWYFYLQIANEKGWVEL